MKTFSKYILLAAALITTAVSTNSCITVGTGINTKATLRGNGILTTKSIQAPAFTKVECARNVEIHLIEQSSRQITVTTDENVMPYVVITCEQGTLKATIDQAILLSDVRVVVEVPMTSEITALRAYSSGEILLRSPLRTQNNLEISASSAGEIQGSLEAPQVILDLSSSAEATLHLSLERLEAHINSAASGELTGRCQNANLLITSAGNLDAEELQIATCQINASSAGSAEIYCTEQLIAEASSAADIEYRGPCRVEKQTSSAGSISLND